MSTFWYASTYGQYEAFQFGVPTPWNMYTNCNVYAWSNEFGLQFIVDDREYRGGPYAQNPGADMNLIGPGLSAAGATGPSGPQVDSTALWIESWSNVSQTVYLNLRNTTNASYYYPRMY